MKPWVKRSLLLVAAAVLAFTGCTSEEGGEARQVDVNLADSLKTYDKVVVKLIDLEDTNNVHVIFEGRLEDPASLPAFPVPEDVGDFIIRVQAFNAEGQLALQSTVEVKGGSAGEARQLPPEALPAVLPTLPGARLTGLEVSAGVLVPAFDPGVFAYALELPFRSDSLAVIPFADTAARLTLNGALIATDVPSAPVALQVGENALRVGVTPKGGSLANAYTLTVKRKAGDQARLASITLAGGGKLTPAFNPEVTEYADTVAYEAQDVKLTATASDSNAVVSFGGEDTVLASNSMLLALSPGSEFLSNITVISDDRAVKKTYTIRHVQLPSGDPALSALSLTDGAQLIPDFEPGIDRYKAVTAKENVSFVAVSPHAGTRIQVDGQAAFSGGASPPVGVKVGITEVLISVTSADGKNHKTYVVTLERSSPNSLLKSLALAGAVFDSAFRADRLQYKATVPRTTEAIRMDFESVAAAAKVAVALNGGTREVVVLLKDAEPLGSVSLALRLGLNLAKLVVTAPDGVSKTTYGVAVFRQPAQIVTLAAVATSPLALPFSTNKDLYSDTLPHSIDTLSFQVRPTDTNALVILHLRRPSSQVLKKEAIGGPGSIPIPYKTIALDTIWPQKAGRHDVPLAVGDNRVQLEVRGEDRSAFKFYTYELNRKASSNPFLAALTVGPSGGPPLTLTPAFRSTQLAYKDTTTVTYVVVTPKAVERTATVFVNNKVVADGSSSSTIALAAGINKILVDVTAPDGVTKRQYSIEIDKRAIVKQPPVFP